MLKYSLIIISLLNINAIFSAAPALTQSDKKTLNSIISNYCNNDRTYLDYALAAENISLSDFIKAFNRSDVRAQCVLSEIRAIVGSEPSSK